MQVDCWHSGHEEDTFMFHLARLVGVGRQSIDALARKESWPAGRPNIRCFHTCDDCFMQRGYFQEFVLYCEFADLMVPL